MTATPDFAPDDGHPTIEVMVTEQPVYTEYDVTACENFEEDKGRWVRMMPKGTLVAAGFDPEFVPT